MGKVRRSFIVIILSIAMFFSILVPVLSKAIADTRGGNGVVSLLCNYENCTQTGDNTYATISDGNTAYAYIVLNSVGDKGVTVYYHTENGSAVAGEDYYAQENQVIYSQGKYGNKREVRIAVQTNTCDVALKNYEGKDYVARSFYIVLDRAVNDDGSELTIYNYAYEKNGKNYNTSGSLEVMLKGNTILTCSGDRFSAYQKQLETGELYWSDIGYSEGVNSGVRFQSGDPEMDKIKKLGYGDYYATAKCWLSSPQDSDEEVTRFIMGNERWFRTSDIYSLSVKGTGAFIGVAIRYDKRDFWKTELCAVIEKNNSFSYVSSAIVENNDYVKYDGTYWFLNSESSGFGASVYRIYETDGKIGISLHLFERCFDVTTPTIKNLYLDTTSLYAVNGKYRLAVRFTEPVRNVSSTKIMAETNTSTRLQFDYVGGEGTDTLYYDCDTNQYENVNIKWINFNNTFSTVAGDNGMNCYLDYGKVTDFAGNTLSSVGIESKKFNVSLDKRIPTIEVEQTHASSTKPNRAPAIPLTLEYFTAGTVYYEWVKADALSSYLSGVSYQDGRSYATGAGVASVIDKLKANAQGGGNSLAGNIKLANTSQDSSIKTQAKFVSATESGEYYLLCYVEPMFNVSSEDNMRLYKYGTYLVDNTKPQFSALTESINALESGGFSRKFSFNVTDENGIDQVTAFVKEANKPNAKVNKVVLPVSNTGTVQYNLSLQNLIDSFYTNSDGVITVDPTSGYYDVEFEIKDKAGNTNYVYNNEYKTLFLSIQPYFEAEIAFDPVGGTTASVGANICSVNSNIRGYAVESTLQAQRIEVSINGGAYVSESTDTDDYNIDVRASAINMVFKTAGYYEFKYRVAGSYSDTFSMYVTDNFKEETATYKKAFSDDLLPVNKVVQISENVQYVFVNGNKQIEREFYGNTANPSFSSDAACLNFLRFYEYQDLKYEVLTTNTASYLNNGSGEGYNKAFGETRTAMSGQVWVRYKRSSWDVNSGSINDWAYYFYAETDDGTNAIDVEKLSSNLKNAINGVCAKICSKIGKNPNASDVYLVDDDHLDPKTRAPYLSENQIALAKPFVFEVSKCGSVLKNAVYSGDPNLFENTIRMKVGGTNYDLPIATNLKLNIEGATKIFIAPYSDSELNFVEIKLKGETTLRDAINSINPLSTICSSGVYVIREFDENGCSEFYVYVDADAPRLGIKLNNSDTVEYIDSNEVANLFAGKLTLVGIGDSYDGDGNLTYSEIDRSAYVAFFKMPGQTLYAIYYRGEISNERLEEGNYLVCVGDRSGNFYSFKIYVAESKPLVEFKSYETKFTVNITNRSVDELLSVEVYCNDVLISSKLLTSQTFTQNGTYRVVIRDKYSSSEYEETRDYAREFPAIDFYYDENNDGYFTRYREGVNNFMAIQSEESYKLVSTSRRLKIRMGSDSCDFEIKGLLPSEYSYNEDTHEIEIKKIAPFYLDIWNKEQTEDILSFKVIVDDFAPYIQVKTDDRKLIYDESQAYAYDTSDMSKPSSIKYLTGNEVIQAIVMQDEKVANDYVAVTIKDDTAIKEVRVYYKNELYKTYGKDDISSDGTMSFYIGNVIGGIKIVAVDLFNNTTSFVFSFSEKTLSEARVNDEVVSPSLSEVYYANDSASIQIAPNTNVHLLYTHNGERINQVFKYENKELYLGKYTATTSDYGVVDFFNGGIKTVDESGNEQYRDKPLVLNGNHAYKPFEDLELYIVCDPVTGKIRVELLAGENAQRLCVRVDQGSAFAEYYEIELSGETAELNFSSSEGSVVTSEEYVYCGTDKVDITYDQNIVKEIKVAYNKISNSFKEESYIYNLSNMFENGEGYYSLRAVNIYGTVTEYNLIYSTVINVSVELSYMGKDSETYSIDYSNEFFTNYGATFKGYNLSVLRAVADDDSSNIESTKSGKEHTLHIKKSAVVYIEDLYGKTKTIHVIVSTDENFKYDTQNEWVAGYSTLANAEEGYTNTKLSIALDQQKLDDLGICQIKIAHGDKMETVYGYDGENFVSYDVNSFKDAIGVGGTGTYQVIFANKYGDVAVRDIHYSAESTLIVKRQTSTNVSEEVISIEDAVNLGVWSNREINLSSTLPNKYYQFFIRSDADQEYREVTLPHVFQLASTSQNGTLKYYVKYVDAYGYSHEIECNLNKQDIICTMVGMNFISLDRADYTKDLIQINFDSNYTATYKLNSLDEVPYSPNEVIYKDGNYTFTIKDNSGNVKTISFTRNSSCKFMVATPNKEVVAYNGGVINVNQLVFDNLGSTSYIKYVRFNGDLIPVTDNMVFTKVGLYELIIEDAVSNTAYFKFNLVNHAINKFDYSVPSGYVITEVYRTFNDMRVTYLDAVDNDKKRLSLVEEGRYDVILKNVYQDSTTNFSITIDHEKPKATLVGCNENATTTNDITLKDLGAYDVVQVYKNGELVATYDGENGESFKAITEGGNYKIVVTNLNGVSVELCFVKKNIASASLSILIIIICFLAASGFFIGLLFRNRSKFDK